jgi:hypothetical protein
LARFELPPEALRAIGRLVGAREEAERAGASFEQAVTAALAAIRRERVENEHAYAAAETLLNERVRGFELIAKAWSDYELARAKAQAEALQRHPHPARRAAEEVREKGRELAKARRVAKVNEWVLALYEWHFPWLTELRDPEWEQSFVEGSRGEEAGADGEADPALHWLTQEEYSQLSSADRNQRALDRYLASRKSPWEVGRDYERYIGYLRERQGFHVTYHGIFKGLEDLGRDLLAERGSDLEVIQCKRWAKERVIHEKHIFQLFGTMVALRIERPDMNVSGTFVTTASVSERARAFAQQLGVRIEENLPLEDYPRIKCNIARQSGERIYHLPFDQQYDSTVVEPERGECYVTTAGEAEAFGFRRAWQWRGVSTT